MRLKLGIIMLLFFLYSCQTSRHKSSEDLSTSVSLECHKNQKISEIDLSFMKGRISSDLIGYKKAALCYLIANRVTLAEYFYQKAYSLDQNDFDVILGLAKSAEQLGNKPMAIKYYEQAYQLNSGSEELWGYYGAFALDHYDVAVAAKSVNYLSGDLKLLYTVYLTVLQGKIEEAKKLWENFNSKTRMSGESDKMIVMAYVANLLGDNGNADKYYQGAKSFYGFNRYKEFKNSLEK